MTTAGRSFDFSTRKLDADRLGDGGEVRVLEVGAEGDEPGGLHLEFDEVERGVVVDDDLDRQVVLGERDEFAEEHRQSPVTGERDDLPSRERGLGADALGQRIGHRPWLKDPMRRRLPFIVRYRAAHTTGEPTSGMNTASSVAASSMSFVRYCGWIVRFDGVASSSRSLRVFA